MSPFDPIVLVAVVLQLLLPLGLLGLLGFRRPRDRLRFGLDSAFVVLYLVAIAWAGLWLALPRWLVLAYGLLLAMAVAWRVGQGVPPGMGREPPGQGGWKELPWIRIPAVASVAILAAVALAGHRPLPGPAVELAFPMAGGVYRVAAGGSTSLLNPHLGTLDGHRFRPWRGQSYAVDLVGSGAWGSRRSPALRPDLDEFLIFGAEIQAPCAGDVVQAVDGHPDVLPPGEAPRTLEGNHVILACDGVWVVLAHMVRGSVAVRPGDPVAPGDPLGRVGNSGSSDEPHLHIHAQTPGSVTEPLSGSPLPIVFDGHQPVRNETLRREPATRTRWGFQDELDSLRKEYGFPGATAAWVTVDGLEGTASTGLADLESGRPMPPEARMLAASIGKSFVAATVLALAGEGTLDLDDPVSRWLGSRPWFARLPNGPSITIRHLLNHTSGLPDHVHDPAFQRCWADGLRHPDLPPPSADSLVAFVTDDPALHPPGEGWAYSDTGYLLLGMVVEEASGRTVFEHIASRFLCPLGLSRTGPSDRRRLPALVPGYVPPDNALGLPERTVSPDGELVWNPALEGAGGGLVSHPLDLARWARALFRGEAMPTPYLDDLLAAVPAGGAGEGVSYGCGVAIRAPGPLGPSWGHAGSIPGYLSSLRYYPEAGIAVAFQINTDGCFAPGVDPAQVMTAMELRLARAALAEHRPLRAAPHDERAQGRSDP